MEVIFTYNEESLSSSFNTSNYKRTEIYYNNLNQADNTASIEIPFNVNIQNFINQYSDKNIKAVIVDNNKSIFTGYVRKNFDFSKKQRNQPMSIELVSPSYLLDIEANSTVYYINQTLGTIINNILTLANVTNIDLSALTQTINFLTIEEGDNLKDLLDDLCQQYGYVYDFNKSGSFYVSKLFDDIPDDKTTIAQIFNGSNCLDEIKITKKEQENDGVSVKWDSILLVNNALIFADTTDGDSKYNTCAIELKSGCYLGDEKNYYITYDCTAGEVKYTTNASLTLVSTNNSGLTYSFENLGTKGKLSIYNKSSSTITIKRINVTGSAYVITATNETKTASGTKYKDLTADYIQTVENAKYFANNYCNWLNYADYTATLKSNSDYDLGSFVKVTDDNLGIVYGRIIKKVYQLLNKPIDYTIEAVSDYSSAESSNTHTQNGNNGASTSSNVSEEKADTDAIKNLTVIAYQNYIELNYTHTDPDEGQTTFYIRKSTDNGATFDGTIVTDEEGKIIAISSDSTTDKTYKYYFDRNSDGYPESAALSNWQFQVIARNNNDYFSTAVNANVNITNYGTWELNAPTVLTRISNRTISLILSQPSRSDNKTIYGNLVYRVQIKRPDIDSCYYKPAESLNPYATADATNEYNYKVADNTGYVESDNVYIQTMPLKGQAYLAENASIEDTLYTFSVICVNEINVSEATEKNATATATSIEDIVKANETTKEAYVESLSAISANLGIIKEGELSGSDTNYWALSNLTDDNGNKRYKGTFHLGDENEYLHFDPKTDDDGNVLLDENGNPVGYKSAFKVGNFTVKSDSTELSDPTYIVDSKNPKHRIKLNSNGIEMQDNSSGSWQTIGKVYIDSAGNLTLTNSDSCPDTATPIAAGTMYHLDNSKNDTNGSNSKSLVYDGTFVKNISPLNNGNQAFRGTIDVPAAATSNSVSFFSDSNTVRVFGTNLKLDGTMESNAQAIDANAAMSTTFGLTAAQVAAHLFKEER